MPFFQFDNFSASSPRFVTTEGTRKNLRPFSRVLLLPQPTIKQIPSSQDLYSELRISKSNYQRATQEPNDFIYFDKLKKRVAKNFNGC